MGYCEAKHLEVCLEQSECYVLLGVTISFLCHFCYLAVVLFEYPDMS